MRQRFRAFLVTLILLLLIAIPSLQAERVLSVDIGGTRIKAAILDNNVSLDDLRNTEITIIPVGDYLSEKLPELLSRENRDGLIARTGEHFDRAYVLLPADITNDGEDATRPDLKIPSHIRKRFEEALEKPVTIQHDGTGGLEGVLVWSRLAEHSIEYPVARVAFGTGIALSYASEPGDVGKISISNMHADWTPLSPILGTNITRGTMVHGNMRKAFAAVSGGAPREPLINAVNVFLQIMLTEMNKAHHSVSTLVIGGGWANLLNIGDIDLGEDLSHIHLVLINHANLDGVDADLIPLLGAFYEY